MLKFSNNAGYEIPSVTLFILIKHTCCFFLNDPGES